ncbi:hypothetical protein ABZ896_36245 [Streptomyces sp. NPDC047072]|uniref:tetratricopeptide repeat protein n=1 Tax=Streptomyces sp. NPDC047072 TaxID=3154809 RepID=UPI0033F21739
MGAYVRPELERLVAEGTAVFLAGMRSENWILIREGFGDWLADAGQDFYARDLENLGERQDGYTEGSLAERRWQRRLAEALLEAPDLSAASEDLRDLIKEFSEPEPEPESDPEPDPAPGLADDHIDFRQSTFHGQVVGVQHNYGQQQSGGTVSAPDTWPYVRDVDPITLGVRPCRRADGESEVPPYVPRDADRTDDAPLGKASLIVVTGGPLSGKTRTAWECLAGPRGLPDTTRIHAPAPGTDLRGLPGVLRDRDGSYVLWLDELEGHLGEHGLDATLLSQLSALHVQVLATMRDELYDEYRFGDGPASRVLSRAVTVELGSTWSAEELGRLDRAAADDARLVDALHWRGERSVPEYLAVGPELWDLWRRAARPGGPHPRGHLLVRAAVDLARCGVTGAIPVALLDRTCGAYDADMGRESPAEAFAWAAERRHGVTGLLVRGEEDGTWHAYGSLVADALRDARLSEVPVAVWRCALEGTGYDTDVHRGVSRAAQAVFEPKAGAGDAEALHMMGLLSEDAGDEATAVDWFRKAVDAGKDELAGHVGELLLARGKAEQALPYLRMAVAVDRNGDGRAERLVGQAHLTLAKNWLKRAADEEDMEAAHQLGDIALGRGELDEASVHYTWAQEHHYAPVARSLGMYFLLLNSAEVAKVFLTRAEDSGDEVAAGLLEGVYLPATLDDAEEYFSDTSDHPLDIAHLGAVLEKKGHPDKARKKYEQAYELGDAYGAYRLADLLHRQGVEDEAAAWYRKAADLGHPAARKALQGNPDNVRE